MNGTINGKLVSGMTDGGTPAYTLDVEGSGKVFLVITASRNGGISSLTIDTDDSVPDDAPATAPDADGTYYRALGDYSVSAGQVMIGSGAVGIGSRVFKLCRIAYTSPPQYVADWDNSTTG